jgi:hypothetical protein
MYCSACGDAVDQIGVSEGGHGELGYAVVLQFIEHGTSL